MTNNTTSPLAADSPLAGLFATIVGTAAVVTATAGTTPVLDFTALGVTLLRTSRKACCAGQASGLPGRPR